MDIDSACCCLCRSIVSSSPLLLKGGLPRRTPNCRCEWRAGPHSDWLLSLLLGKDRDAIPQVNHPELHAGELLSPEFEVIGREAKGNTTVATHSRESPKSDQTVLLLGTQAYYVHNFKGSRPAVLFKCYPGPWQVRSLSTSIDKTWSCVVTGHRLCLVAFAARPRPPFAALSPGRQDRRDNSDI
jgi:hypothetical protein